MSVYFIQMGDYRSEWSFLVIYFIQGQITLSMLELSLQFCSDFKLTETVR